jgi:hypothetical protein
MHGPDWCVEPQPQQVTTRVLRRVPSSKAVRACSQDMRDRVVSSVAGGRTCRATIALFRVTVASVVKWSQRWRLTFQAGVPHRASGLDRGEAKEEVRLIHRWRKANSNDQSLLTN